MSKPQFFLADWNKKSVIDIFLKMSEESWLILGFRQRLCFLYFTLGVGWLEWESFAKIFRPYSFKAA